MKGYIKEIIGLHKHLFIASDGIKDNRFHVSSENLNLE
jgi:hypothetical protein